MDSSPSNPRGAVHSATPVKTQKQMNESDFMMDVVSTPEIQKWMSSIERQLNEVCSIATDGKLNSEQKMKISNLCRKIGSDTSQMAVVYQSLKAKALQAYNMVDALKEKCNLSEHINEIKQTINNSSTAGNVSFANIVKKSPKDILRPNNLSSVAIYPTNKKKSSDETKTLVQNIVRPDEMKLHVRSIRKTNNGGVIISTETKNDAEKVKNVVHLSLAGLIANDLPKRKPRLVIVGVPSSLTEDEVFRCIFEQNVAEKLPDMSVESFLPLVKLSHKSGKKDASTCNYIIEVPANIRKILISHAKVFINWTSCPVRDFTLVTRCYKCQLYGHAAKTCREVNSTCGHCGEAGHAMSECAKKADSPKCATCLRFKKPSNHKTGDGECPAKKIAEYRYINSVDYEGA